MCSNELSSEQLRQWLNEFAAIVSIDPGSIDLITGARDTNEEVKQFKEIVGVSRVIAVSTASHIPRIMKKLARNEINAVPAPCGHAIRRGPDGDFSPISLFPNAESMLYAQTAVYERLGQLWEIISGKSGK